MPPRKKTGRAAAEAAYANLLKENTALVGNVGEAFATYVGLLEEAATARERYEEARTAAVKGGAVTNDQLEQMGYKKTTKLPAPPTRTAAEKSSQSAAADTPNPSTNGAATAAAQPAGVGATTGEDH